jgi:hypothetical protein
MGISVGTNAFKATRQAHDQTGRANANQKNTGASQKKSADSGSIASAVKDAVTKPDSSAGRLIGAASRVGSLISTMA